MISIGIFNSDKQIGCPMKLVRKPRTVLNHPPSDPWIWKFLFLPRQIGNLIHPNAKYNTFHLCSRYQFISIDLEMIELPRIENEKTLFIICVELASCLFTGTPGLLRVFKLNNQSECCALYWRMPWLVRHSHWQLYDPCSQYKMCQQPRKGIARTTHEWNIYSARLIAAIYRFCFQFMNVTPFRRERCHKRFDANKISFEMSTVIWFKSCAKM